MGLWDTAKSWLNPYQAGLNLGLPDFLSGKNVEYPKPSAEETALMQEMLRQIQEQAAWNQKVLPIQMKELGYVKTYKDPKYQTVDINRAEFNDYVNAQGDNLDTNSEEYLKLKNNLTDSLVIANRSSIESVEKAFYNEDGTLGNEGYWDWFYGSGMEGEIETDWREMTEGEYYASLNERERQIYDIQKAQNERNLQAIRGELPLSSALQDQKQKEFENLKEVYGIEGDTLETATAQDTIASQNLSEFQKKWAQLEEAQRFGQASSSLEASVLSQGLTTGQTQNTIGTLAGIGAGKAPNTDAFNSIMNPMMQYTMGGYQAQAANQANQTSRNASLLGLLAYMWSSKDYKKNIKRKSAKDEDMALKKLRNTKSYEYDYKPGMGMPGRQLGGIAEESPIEVKALNGKAISIPAKMEMINMGLKSLARKVDRMEKRA